MTQKEFEDRIGEKFVGDYSEVEECCCIYNHRTTKTNQKYPSVNL